MTARSYALQFAAIALANLMSIWGATQWVASELGFQAALGAPLLTILGQPIYLPWMLFLWWLAFNDQAASLFTMAGGGVALCAILITGLAFGGAARRIVVSGNSLRSRRPASAQPGRCRASGRRLGSARLTVSIKLPLRASSSP